MSLNRRANRAGVDVATYQEFLSAAQALEQQYQQFGQARFGDTLLAEYIFALQDNNTSPASEGRNILAGLQQQPELIEQLEGMRNEVELLQDQYNLEFFQLARDFGINTTVVDDDKIYWMSAGNPFQAFGGSGNPYGEEAQLSNVADIGGFVRDSRTDSVSLGDFLGEVFTPQNLLRFALTAGKDAFTWLDAIDAVRFGYDTFQDAEANNFAPQEGGDLQGELPDNTLDSVLDAIVGIVDTVFGGANDGIMIPIPGLPISIPGNMTFEDLLEVAVDIATDTGQAIEDVLDTIMGGIEAAGESVPEPGTGGPIVDEGGGDPPSNTPDDAVDPGPGDGTPVDEPPIIDPPVDDPGVDDSGDGNVYIPVCTLPRPGFGTFQDIQNGRIWDEVCSATHNADGTPKTQDDPNEPPDDDPTVPGVTPGDPNDPNDPGVPGIGGDPNDSPDDGGVPGLGDGGELGDDDENGFPGLGGIAAIGAGLIPFLLNQERERDPLSPGRTLMQPNESRRQERPDYGVPDPVGLFDFAQPVPQPTQVGFDPEPRRETISATERERLRRLLRQGMI